MSRSACHLHRNAQSLQKQVAGPRRPRVPTKTRNIENNICPSEDSGMGNYNDSLQVVMQAADNVERLLLLRVNVSDCWNYFLEQSWALRVTLLGP